MARPPSRLTKRATAMLLTATLATCGVLSGVGPSAAQDTWMLFQKKERPGRGGGIDSSGVREGDRPLEPPGGSRGAPRSRGDEPQGYEANPRAPRSAAPVAVERQELAPLADPEPEAPLASTPFPTSPSSAWDTRTTPIPDDRFDDRGFLPSPRRDREGRLAPPRPPAQPPAPQRAPAPLPPPANATPRPALDGLASIAPKTLEEIIGGIELPPRSAALATLWPEPWRAAGAVPPTFETIRIEALRRAGAIDALKTVLARTSAPSDPALAIIVLRAQILAGNREAGCALAGDAIRNRASLPVEARRDALLAAGYCAMSGGNADAGKLTADLMRSENIDAPFARAVLEGAGAGGKAPPALPASVGVLDYRIGEIAGVVWPNTLVDRAEPAVLAIIATSQNIDPGLKALAAERAARLALLPAEALAAQYRDLPQAPGDLADPLASKQTGAMRRALLLQAADAEAAPDRKARLLAALLEDAGKVDLRTAAARTLGPVVERMRPAPDLTWFADMAAEILVQSRRGDAVEAWAGLTRDLEHWRVLGALASDTAMPTGSALASLERIAHAGRLEAPQLHRIVTVLDALDVQMPIPLWEAASRTPQPTDGHLPATGVLGELKAASDKRDGALTVVRAAQAMGPASAAEVNLLTLGDVIRALKNGGFAREARTLGIEALIEKWPTTAGR